jgi:hypothetical protein
MRNHGLEFFWCSLEPHGDNRNFRLDSESHLYRVKVAPRQLSYAPTRSSSLHWLRLGETMWLAEAAPARQRSNLSIQRNKGGLPTDELVVTNSLVCGRPDFIRLGCGFPPHRSTCPVPGLNSCFLVRLLVYGSVREREIQTRRKQQVVLFLSRRRIADVDVTE